MERYHLPVKTPAIQIFRIEQLRKEIARGIDQADSGAVKPFNVKEIKAQARKQLRLSRKTKMEGSGQASRRDTRAFPNASR